jgi:hypothetical protein
MNRPLFLLILSISGFYYPTAEAQEEARPLSVAVIAFRFDFDRVQTNHCSTAMDNRRVQDGRRDPCGRSQRSSQSTSVHLPIYR